VEERKGGRQYFVLPTHIKLNGLSLCILFNKLVINNKTSEVVPEHTVWLTLTDYTPGNVLSVLIQ